MEKIIFTFRFLADGRHVAALSNSDVLRCLVGLHMAWLDLLRSMHSIHIDMAHYVTESPFFVFGVFTVFVFGIYFSNFFESSILRIWCV